MTDKTGDIEKCAKLMGLGIIDGIAPIPTPDGQWREFNPLTNKSHLMDLECALGIQVFWFPDGMVTANKIYRHSDVHCTTVEAAEDLDDRPDKFTARAHAVVAVAVQIYDRTNP